VIVKNEMCGMNSIGIEIVEDYCRMAFKRLNSENQDLFRKNIIIYDNADGNRISLL